MKNLLYWLKLILMVTLLLIIVVSGILALCWNHAEFNTPLLILTACYIPAILVIKWFFNS